MRNKQRGNSHTEKNINKKHDGDRSKMKRHANFQQNK